MSGKNTSFVDEEIPYSTVSLVNRETHKLDPPTSLHSLIEWARGLGEDVTTTPEGSSKPKRQKQGYYLQLVGHDPPVVKLVSKFDAFKYKQLGAKQQRASIKKNITKEIQLTWGVAEGDWKHKANKVRAELVKGNRVDIVFAAKAKVKPPSPEEMRAVETKMVEELSDIGFRWKDTEFTKSIMVLHIRNVDALPQNKKVSPKSAPSATP